jgi:glycosyltransferase involved in cell wall biosynthesis
VAGGARDSYQLPIALHEAQQLHAFVTDFYAPLDRLPVRTACALLPRALAGKFKRRYSSELPSRFVKSHPALLLNNRNRDGWIEYNRALGQYAGELAARSGCGIMSYAHIATSAFLVAKTEPKILIQMQPHPTSVRNALLSDQLLPELQEPSTINELGWPEPVFDTLCREPLLADQCIVASNYTRRTLIENGVNPNLIALVPYGVDIDFFAPSTTPENGKFRVLFVGQPVRQKGLHYLLEAWTRRKFPKSELRVVARTDRDNAILRRYAGKFTFVGALGSCSLREEYRQADLLCLPSLSEGFGLVTLESLACGTPVLASDAAGCSELLRDGEDGFVVPAANLASLMEALESAYSDRRRLRDMRIAARAKAQNFPWSRFRQSIRAAVEDFQTVISS